MKLNLTIDLDTGATVDYEDISRILTTAARRMSANYAGAIGTTPQGSNILDTNGNTIGDWSVDSEESQEPKSRPFTSGDHCRFIHGPHGEPWVQHWDCDDYPDRTITDNETGKIVINEEN